MAGKSILLTVFQRGSNSPTSAESLPTLLADLFTTHFSTPPSIPTPRPLSSDVFQLTLPPSPLPLSEIRTSPHIHTFETTHSLEIVLQHASIYTRARRLAVFDMDSTLIDQEVIDELAAFLGVKDKVAAITARAMRGELDFSASLRERVRLLEGLDSGVWETLKREKITFRPGARELCFVLKKLGVKMAVLSGGFMPLATWVRDELGLDYAYANNLVVGPDGLLTGEVDGGIVHAERKRELLREIAEKEGIDVRQTLAVGDGANDLLMMGAAGLGIAVDAKEKVQREAPARINPQEERGLVEVLFIMGYTEEEIQEVLSERK